MWHLEIWKKWFFRQFYHSLVEVFTMRKNLPKTLDFANIHYYLVNILKFTKYLVNVPKFTQYLVNSYHQKGVKHYVLTN